MSQWRDLLMLNKPRQAKPVGNLRIFIRIRIRLLHVVQSADPHFTRSPGMAGRYLPIIQKSVRSSTPIHRVQLPNLQASVILLLG